jgi:hypothetical protein
MFERYTEKARLHVLGNAAKATAIFTNSVTSPVHLRGFWEHQIEL